MTGYIETTFTHDNCIVRVRKPDQMNRERLEKVTENFLKNVIREREVINR